jgi:hypothetical protein
MTVNENFKPAINMLLEILSSGPLLKHDIFKEANKRGVSQHQLDMAKKELNIIARRVGADNTGVSGYKKRTYSRWELPVKIEGNGE